MGKKEDSPQESAKLPKKFTQFDPGYMAQLETDLLKSWTSGMSYSTLSDIRTLMLDEQYKLSLRDAREVAEAIPESGTESDDPNLIEFYKQLSIKTGLGFEIPDELLKETTSSQGLAKIFESVYGVDKEELTFAMERRLQAFSYLRDGVENNRMDKYDWNVVTGYLNIYYRELKQVISE